MGCIYRHRKQVADGKRIAVGPYWIAYYAYDPTLQRRRQFHESSGSRKHEDAKTLLQRREGDIARGVPVSPQMNRLTFDQGRDNLLRHLRNNHRKDSKKIARQIQLHLAPVFGGRKMTTIRGSDVTYYTTLRLSEGAAPATVNRELATLGRLLNLAIEDELLWHRPKIRLLKEDNVRTGFFDCEHYEDVLRHLPEPLRPVITFAYVTGWRVNSEVLTLTWAQVDLKSGVVRLEPGQTKNRQGRQFYFTKTSALGRLLQSRRDAADRDQSETKSIIRHVFYRLVEKRGRHNKTPKPIKAFGKAWKTACRSAGCPGRIPHDLRRTAVRNLIRSGVPERAAMSATGHLTRSVFDRYHIVSETDLREASQRLDDYLGQQLGSQ